MPNWCSNVLTVSGTTAAGVDEVMAALADGDDRLVDFGRIIPVPEDADRVWYDENWGTKWNANGPTAFRHSELEVRYYFDTAWSPPEPVAVRLSEMFPDVVVALAFDEPGMDFGGVLFLRGGLVLERGWGGCRSRTWEDEIEFVQIDEWLEDGWQKDLMRAGKVDDDA